MRSSHIGERTLAASLIAFGVGLAVTPTASADPNADTTPAPAPGPPGVAAPAPGPPGVNAPVPGAAAPAAAACKQFEQAWRFSSKYYNEFANSIAGEGAHVDYQDPTVRDDNVDGRTALRKAAATALQASGTPGLQPEVANPMRSWSLRATKLLLIMGVRGGGDTLNNAATQLNDDAENAQMACAKAGAYD